MTDGRIAVHAGQVLTYVLTYRNVGAQDATGVELTAGLLPPGRSFFDPGRQLGRLELRSDHQLHLHADRRRGRGGRCACRR